MLLVNPPSQASARVINVPIVNQCCAKERALGARRMCKKWTQEGSNWILLFRRDKPLETSVHLLIFDSPLKNCPLTFEDNATSCALRDQDHCLRRFTWSASRCLAKHQFAVARFMQVVICYRMLSFWQRTEWKNVNFCRIPSAANVSHVRPGLWGRSPCNFGWPEPKIFRRWSPSLKFWFLFHRQNLWGKRVVQIMQWILVFNGPNRSGAGAKKFRYLEPELEIWVPALQPCVSGPWPAWDTRRGEEFSEKGPIFFNYVQ